MKKLGVMFAIGAVLAIVAAPHADVMVEDKMFPVGNAQGSIQKVVDTDVGSVTPIITSQDTSALPAWVAIELDKVWYPRGGVVDGGLTNLNSNSYGGPMGVPAASPMAIQIKLPSAAAAGVDEFAVRLRDERVANNTGVTWLDFHIVIFMASEGTFSVRGEAENGIRLPDNVVHPDDPTDITELNVDFFGGSWPSDGYLARLFRSTDPVNDPLRLVVPLLPEDEIRIIIKEWPTVPEPATMGLLSVGSLAVVAIRRRRRK